MYNVICFFRFHVDHACLTNEPHDTDALILNNSLFISFFCSSTRCIILVLLKLTFILDLKNKHHVGRSSFDSCFEILLPLLKQIVS